MQNSDYLIVHKKILPEYFNQVIQARSLLENHEVALNKVLDLLVNKEF